MKLIFTTPRPAAAILFFFIMCAEGCFLAAPSHLLRAEELRAAGKFEAAIEEYQLYIDQRIQRHDYTEADNPYFFYLLIGDSYLGMDDTAKAEEAYLKAKENGTAANLVAGKLRAIGQYYEVRGRYAEAIEILRKHRELDPLLFDLDIDRNHKNLIAAEDAKRPQDLDKEY